MNSAFIAASCTALTLKNHINASLAAYDSSCEHYVKSAANAWAGMGAPGTEGIFESNQCAAPNSATLFSALGNSGATVQL